MRSSPAPSMRALFALALLAVSAAPSFAATPAANAPAPAAAWVTRSNQNAQVLLDVMARFAPEQAGFFGVAGMDEKVLDLNPGFEERADAAIREAVTTLEARMAEERDPAVKQDLQILIDAAHDQLRGSALERKYDLPYFNVSEVAYRGLRALLDDQVPAERRAAALTRLRRYAGIDKGYAPITELAEAHTRSRLADAKLRGPVREQVDQNFENGARYVAGIRKLFTQYQIKGWEKPLATLEKQLAAYDAFVRQEIVPRSRTDFRQPPELYEYTLEQVGVDLPVDELQSRAKVAFLEIQGQMQSLAPLVAREKGLASSDYRDVIRALKQKQITGEAILPHYRARIREIEEIIRREKIVTLPDREAQIELASEAESAEIPAPHMRPPRLIGNTGQKGTFVLPLRIPGKEGEKQFDDFTFEAASWTLSAHEARPGHELQFSAMVEHGVSIARALFAFNSVNAEGWGLYAERELQPYEPLEGQLVALQHRLMRAARAFLDPGMQLGTIGRDEAYRVLREDVVLSDAMATQEVERYMFRSPGQATAYFTGYNRLLEIRADAERLLGPRFDRQAFNDFVLAQGLLPPSLLSKAVIEEFVPSRMQRTER